MILSIYNKSFLMKNDPKFLYKKISRIFELLISDLFIFPEVLEDKLDDGSFYLYLISTTNFNELKIYNSFFKPELLLTKIESDHLNYLNNLNKIYNKFSYNLSYFSSYKEFIYDFEIENENNFFKYMINNEDRKSHCSKRSPILNTISYRFIKLFVEKYANSTKYTTFNKISALNKSLIYEDFILNLNSDVSRSMTEITIKKILKISNYSEEYYLMVFELFNSNMYKLSQLFEKFIERKLTSYFYVEINFKIIEHVIEHITHTILNYPKDIIYFVNKEKIQIPPPNDNSDSEEFIIDNFENNAFDINNDNIIDEIWDPDDDNDYVNLLRKLNPTLDEYYKHYFVIPDNKTFDKGSYLSHIEILENQIFTFITNLIKNRENETNSLFYAAAQFSEKSPLQYLNSLLSIMNSHINDTVYSKLYDEIDDKYLPNRVINMLIKNIYINDNLFKKFFDTHDFSKSVLKSKSIEYAILNKFSKIISDFFDSPEVKDFMFNEFFNNDYLNVIKQRYPNVRDDLIDNLNNLISSFKFVFSKRIYDDSLFNNIKNEFIQIYSNCPANLTEDDIIDIYENYKKDSNLQIEDYRLLIKKVMISSTYSIYIDLFLDNFRINKKFENV
jgi:hypothetical protein